MWTRNISMGVPLFLLEFHTCYSRYSEDYHAWHFFGFESHGLASSGELLIPGDIEVLAFKTIDLFSVHGAKTSSNCQRIFIP